ncbi:hypothetical protein K435DRAFT_871372 [Dendrothele bispora CBS 962.96]|uniref:Uncharacterized protein n=1 Tax=Dendrothele bispora (strain CBS 962.96) TaxID=1314807 RepID=A0A4S8L4K1_DENBC|nr:hypothetical protein K435DRAFT_871372 [Dendrothele bispora CBS 962.96]
MGTLKEVVVKESTNPRQWSKDDDIPSEFELGSEFSFSARLKSFSLPRGSFRTFRPKTKNGNKFAVALWEPRRTSKTGATSSELISSGILNISLKSLFRLFVLSQP